MKALVLGVLFLLPLASCGAASQYADANGDVDAEASSYRDVMSEERASSVLSRVKNGETVYLFHAFSGCSTCAKVEPYVVGALKRHPLQISLLYKRGDASFDLAAYNEDTALYEQAFPKNEDGTKGFLRSYPQLYRLEGSDCTPLDFLDACDSANSLAYFLGKCARLSGLTHFRSYESASSFALKSNCPLYLYDSSDKDSASFYKDEIRSRGLNVGTAFGILDYSLMSNVEKTAALAGFSLLSYEPTISFGSTAVSITKEAAKAASLVRNYY